ncbi:YcxB family protein [Parasulfuritortus cantonensis]|uniref:YcxB family protein n=1 Tax=Parasulfuritortus cantonensis TaxID=2528202 RepID=A0A4R1B3B3_9PROT|nr:YcxB family protein [Parasulfuritortus cantonensis]TCJ11970.1 YcxB family protein [Parasulfuritortus cantonensis]
MAGRALTASTVAAEYRISELDYVRAMQLFGRPTARQRLAYAASALVLAGLVLFAGPLVAGMATGGLIGGGAGYLIVRRLISPALARRHYRRYKAMHDPFTVELAAEGVRFRTPDATGLLPWDKMLKWRQDADYVLIYPMPRLFHIVPKAVAGQGFDVQALTDRLRAELGEPV